MQALNSSAGQMAISRFGKGGFGSTLSATAATLRAMSTTSISIQSNMDWSGVCTIGNIHRFIATFAKAYFRMIGRVKGRYRYGELAIARAAGV